MRAVQGAPRRACRSVRQTRMERLRPRPRLRKALHARRAARPARAQQDEGFVALKAYFPRATLEADVELHVVPGGYVGINPVESGTIGVCALLRRRRARHVAAPRRARRRSPCPRPPPRRARPACVEASGLAASGSACRPSPASIPPLGSPCSSRATPLGSSLRSRATGWPSPSEAAASPPKRSSRTTPNEPIRAPLRPFGRASRSPRRSTASSSARPSSRPWRPSWPALLACSVQSTKRPGGEFAHGSSDFFPSRAPVTRCPGRASDYTARPRFASGRSMLARVCSFAGRTSFRAAARRGHPRLRSRSFLLSGSRCARASSRSCRNPARACKSSTGWRPETAGVSTLFVVLEGGPTRHRGAARGRRRARPAIEKPSARRGWAASRTACTRRCRFLSRARGLYAKRDELREAARQTSSRATHGRSNRATGALPRRDRTAAAHRTSRASRSGSASEARDPRSLPRRLLPSRRTARSSSSRSAPRSSAATFDSATEALRRIARPSIGSSRLVRPAHPYGFGGDLETGVSEVPAINANLTEVGIFGAIAHRRRRLPLFPPRSARSSHGAHDRHRRRLDLRRRRELSIGYLNSSTGFLVSIVAGNGINFGIIYMARYLEARRARARRRRARSSSRTARRGSPRSPRRAAAAARTARSPSPTSAASSTSASSAASA